MWAAAPAPGAHRQPGRASLCAGGRGLGCACPWPAAGSRAGGQGRRPGVPLRAPAPGPAAGRPSRRLGPAAGDGRGHGQRRGLRPRPRLAVPAVRRPAPTVFGTGGAGGLRSARRPSGPARWQFERPARSGWRRRCPPTPGGSGLGATLCLPCGSWSGGPPLHTRLRDSMDSALQGRRRGEAEASSIAGIGDR